MRIQMTLERHQLIEALTQYSQTSLPSAVVNVVREAVRQHVERIADRPNFARDVVFLERFEGLLRDLSIEVGHAEDAYYLPPTSDMLVPEVKP